MLTSAEAVFWACGVLIAYIYAGYPLLVALTARIRRLETVQSRDEPPVTILIAARNEERDIRNTIENKLALDYPPEKLDVIVVSDGSEDRTDEIVREFRKRRVTLIRQEPRAGKTAALNLAAPLARGAILVFSDANSIYSPDALRALVRHFADPGVGYVTGRMVYVDPGGTPVGKGCSAYMRYENLLRKWETLAGSIVGVDGGIDAMRKELYRSMRPDQLPDFVLPLRVVEQGRRVVYEENAVLREQALALPQDEYRMRVRVSLRALWALRDMGHLLNPWRYGFFALELLSHKVLRYGAFLFLLGLFASGALLVRSAGVYAAAFAAQCAFYCLAALAWIMEKKGRKPRMAFAPYYFSLLNLAAAHAFFKFLSGEKSVVWKPRLG